MKPWTFKKLQQHLKEQGYLIQTTNNNEWKVVNLENKPIAFFATRHGNKSNREILAPYIRKILQAIENDKNDENNTKQL